MVGKKKKDPFCGDMSNSLAKSDREFHWSREYDQYLDLHAEDVSSKHFRIVGLVKDGCMPEVFDVPKFVLWCSKCFDTSRRRIQVGDNTIQPIRLNPLVFHRTLRLPKANKEFKIAKATNFVTNHGGPNILFPYFTDSLFGLKKVFSSLMLVYSRVHLGNSPGYLHGSLVKNPHYSLLGMFYMFFLVPSRWTRNLIGLKSFQMKFCINYRITNKLGDFS